MQRRSARRAASASASRSATSLHQAGEALHLLAVEGRQHQLALLEVGALVEQDHRVACRSPARGSRAPSPGCSTSGGAVNISRTSSGSESITNGGVASEAEREALAVARAAALEQRDRPRPPAERLQRARHARSWRQWSAVALIVRTRHVTIPVPGSAPYDARRVRARPNVVLFVVDDMGWMDSGAYGSEYYETPNIDRLAEAGMLFTDAYAAAPLCSPTPREHADRQVPGPAGRSPRPTGHMHGARRPAALSGVGAARPPVISPQSRRHLRPGRAHARPRPCSDAGYRTGHFGKWHLGAPAAPLARAARLRRRLSRRARPRAAAPERLLLALQLPQGHDHARAPRAST